MGRRVLVTGAARSTGRRLVGALAGDPEVELVVAVDEQEPPEPFPAKAEHLAVDLRSPALVRAVQSAGIDTCVHLGVTAEPRAAGGRAAMKERNVLGTMQLLAAAYHAPDLRRLVLKSTTAVYGSASHDPAVWTEAMDHEAPRHGFGKDAVEVEDYVRAFDRRRPDVAVTVLRLANQVGPTVDNPLTRYFELPLCPTVFGFDPRLQFLHEEDTAEVLSRATLGPAVRGTFNVAGDGVVLLSQAIRIAGKPPLPIPEPLVNRVAQLVGQTVDFSPEQVRFLQYGRVADTAAVRGQLGFSPRWTSPQAFEDFAATRLRKLVTAERVARLEDEALAALGARRRQLEEAATADSAKPGAPKPRPPGAPKPRPLAPGPPEGEPSRATASGAPVVHTPPADPEPEPSGPLLDWAEEALEFLGRRVLGEYQVDEFGHDPDLVEHVLAPLLRPLYRRWWRVETRGLEHVPATGPALVVGNHAGTLPFDALMVALALLDEHPAHRSLRMLAADLAFDLPLVAPLARKSGNTLACGEDARRLLEAGELVGVWPEGYKGLGKPYRERYRLQRFGRGGFVEVALRTGAPIVPVAVVGSEEIYPMVANLRRLARLLGFPYFPVTPTFPLLGPLGAIPLPSKWVIEFCPPIETAQLGPDAILDPMVLFDLTDQVRDTIQQTVHQNLLARPSVFG